MIRLKKSERIKKRKLTRCSSMKKIVKIFILASLVFTVFIISGCGKKDATGQESGAVTRLEPVAERGSGHISYGHAKYQFDLLLPDYLIEGELTPTVMGSFQFPESYTTGTNLTAAYVFINRKARTCEELGYGIKTQPEWHNGKKVLLDPRFKENVFVGEVEFKRMFCSAVQDSKSIDALVYTTERMNEPVSLTLVFVSNALDGDSLKIYDPAVFEEEYVKILETYKNLKSSIEE